MGVKVAHFSSNIHGIIIIRGIVFQRKIRIISSSITGANEWGLTVILDLLEGCGSNKAIRREDKKMPTASHAMSGW